MSSLPDSYHAWLNDQRKVRKENGLWDDKDIPFSEVFDWAGEDFVGGLRLPHEVKDKYGIKRRYTRMTIWR